MLTPADDDAISAMKDKILALAPDIDFTKAIRAGDLSLHPKLQMYLQQHTRPSKYIFQWMSDPVQLPPLPLAEKGTTVIPEDAGMLHSPVHYAILYEGNALSHSIILSGKGPHGGHESHKCFAPASMRRCTPTGCEFQVHDVCRCLGDAKLPRHSLCSLMANTPSSC